MTNVSIAEWTSTMSINGTKLVRRIERDCKIVGCSSRNDGTERIKFEDHTGRKFHVEYDRNGVPYTVDFAPVYNRYFFYSIDRKWTTPLHGTTRYPVLR
jgi:hypothetical protein